MTDENPTPTPEETSAKLGDPIFEAPADLPEDKEATGYAVYDRVLGRYVSEVTPGKPSNSDAKRAANGHAYKVVRV